MRVTKNKIEKCIGPGDVVYVICPGGVYKEATVFSIEEDSVDTDLDLLFFDEIGETWCLHEATAKNITRKSQKNVI